jgi:hypothetical protein
MTTEPGGPVRRSRLLALALCAAPVLGIFCWFVVPWSPSGCRLSVASLRTTEGARYEITQTFDGILELYYPRLFYRRSASDNWLGYWLGKEELFWRAELEVDDQTGHIRVVRGGEVVGDFDPERRTLWHRLHARPMGALEEVRELEMCADR